MKNYIYFFLFLFFFRIDFNLYSDSIHLYRETIYEIDSNLTKRDLSKINSVLELLIQSVIDKDKNKLLGLVSQKDGIFIEENSYKTFQEFERDLNDTNSYIDIFFFDTEKLIQHTKNLNSKTVRDLLILSGGIFYELYIDSRTQVTIKFKFSKNKIWEKELNQAILKKDNLKWYLFKIF